MSVPPTAVIVARYGLPIEPEFSNMPQSMRDELAAYRGEDGCVVEVVLNHERGVMEFTVWTMGDDL